jgi:hypothetical protein
MLADVHASAYKVFRKQLRVDQTRRCEQHIPSSVIRDFRPWDFSLRNWEDIEDPFYSKMKYCEAVSGEWLRLHMQCHDLMYVKNLIKFALYDYQLHFLIWFVATASVV